MATYQVFVPPGIGDARRRADRTIFVREAFSFAAFVFGPLYLLYRGLWLASVGWIVIAGAVELLGHAFDLPWASRALLDLLLALLTGFEAGSLRQMRLRRQRYIGADLLTAATLEQAERAFFSSEDARPLPVAPSAVGRPGTGPSSDIIGLFPQAGDV